MIAGVLASGSLAGCSQKTALQKKTAKYQKMSKRGNAPCPCDSN